MSVRCASMVRSGFNAWLFHSPSAGSDEALSTEVEPASPRVISSMARAGSGAVRSPTDRNLQPAHWESALQHKSARLLLA